MSRSRAKGTRGENYFLPRLRKLFYPNYDGPEEEHPLQRAPLKGVNDWGDFLGVPWLHEAKNTRKPLFQQWARTAEDKAKGEHWVVMWKGDLRSKGNGPYVLMPLDTYETLTDVYEGVVGFRRPREFELIPEEEEMTVEEQQWAT